MAARKTIQLGDNSRTQLQRIVKRARKWRERGRAQTLLLQYAGAFAQEVAQQTGLSARGTYYAHALAPKRYGLAA